MYSYVIEFNLSERGDAAQEFLADAARTWPRLWDSIPGVSGTLLLSSALALGGNFDYQWRVDIEALSTLGRIDETIRSAKGDWRKVVKEWFRNRTVARAHVSSHVTGDESYCRVPGGKAGAIHLVLHAQSGESGQSAERLEAVRSVPGVVTTQVLRPVLGSGGTQEHLWLRLESLDSLDGVENVPGVDVGSGRLFGELREVDGTLFAGA